MSSASALSSIDSKRLLRTLRKLGVEVVKNARGKTSGKGGHTAVRGPDGKRSIVVSRELQPVEVKTILKQLGISHEDYLDAL